MLVRSGGRSTYDVSSSINHALVHVIIHQNVGDQAYQAMNARRSVNEGLAEAIEIKALHPDHEWLRRWELANAANVLAEMDADGVRADRYAFAGRYALAAVRMLVVLDDPLRTKKLRHKLQGIAGETPEEAAAIVDEVVRAVTPQDMLDWADQQPGRPPQSVLDRYR